MFTCLCGKESKGGEMKTRGLLLSILVLGVIFASVTLRTDAQSSDEKAIIDN